MMCLRSIRENDSIDTANLSRRKYQYMIMCFANIQTILNKLNSFWASIVGDTNSIIA